MPLLTLYFQLHQPFRLHPHRDKFLWEEMNREIFEKVASKCYLPALSMFQELISVHDSFKITLSMSGTFLEQAGMYQPDVITALQRLLDVGADGMRVEYLDETHYHSLSSLFADPAKQEFQDQVSLHRDQMRKTFGVRPTSFRNTELMYNNDIADTVHDMGYRSILCEKRADMFAGENRNISPNAIFRARGNGLIVIPRNRDLSDDIAFRFPHDPISPEDYAESISRIDGEAVMLGYDFEHIGEHISEDKGIFEFWRKLPEALDAHPNIVLANPTEIADKFEDAECPVVDIPGLSTSSWADATRDTFGWLGTLTQYELFKDIENLETEVKKAGGELLIQWRKLTTSDHVYFLHERTGEDHAVHSYFNPYGGSITQAVHVLTRKIDYFESSLRRFKILKRSERTAVLLIAPETGRLPEDMGPLARYISGKSGGLGEVVSALCEGLIERNIDVHLTTLNLKKRFQRESSLDETEWREIRYKTDADKIHLVSSSIFSGLSGAYAGDPRLNAAEFQKEVINSIIKLVRAGSKGKLIIHSHDWMAGGAITAYTKSRGIPILHTVHNSFTGHIPLDMLFGVDINQLSDLFYFSEDRGRRCIDCQATAIKNATLINFVGQRFLEEVVKDYFTDRDIIPPSVRQEVREKYYYGSALAVINAPSRTMYPENCNHLVRKYGPDDDVIAAKRENLMEFQKRMGLAVTPEAILFYWPSRLDPLQKGVHLLEDIILKFVIDYSDVQFALVADGVGGDRSHEETMGRIAWASGGKIAYHHFNEELSMLGFAAASDVFGASLYEPCGQIDQVGNLFGATATNRDTGGYHDKIRELRLKIDGAPQDVGNGFLFRDYDSGGLRYGLEKSVRFHRYPMEIKETQIRRIMKEARKQYDLSAMIAEYVRLYERLNDNNPLA
ncbi:MAG: glycogen/starch synthase [Deltaproteobacteria bacterium]|nr:glycogen/starch synthase [Deltaproteobacteria bacterium]